MTLPALRMLGAVAALAGAWIAVPAFAQEAEPAVVDACPRKPLRIYFASGDLTASPQTEALIGKIGETASACEPDNLDLVAHFDVNVDGDRAMAVALERLAKVAEDLVAQGISPDRIRIAARAARRGEGGTASLNQIDIMFRKAEAYEPAEPVRQPVRGDPSQSI